MLIVLRLFIRQRVRWVSFIRAALGTRLVRARMLQKSPPLKFLKRHKFFENLNAPCSGVVFKWRLAQSDALAHYFML